MSNEDGHSVTVVDTQSATVVDTIAVGKRPRGLKLNHDGSRLFVAVSGLPKCPPSVPDEECAKLERDLQADGIAVIDTASGKVLQVLQAGSDPEQFALTTDGKRLFVANEDTATTSVVDIATAAVIARIPVGREPEGVVAAPDGRWILVTNETDNSVSVIDAHTLKVAKSVSVGQRPRDIAFTGDGRIAYVSGEFDASLYRIDMPGAESVEKLVQLRKEARPMALALDAQRKRLYASTGRGGTVAVIDLVKSELVTEVAVGARPWGMAISRDGKRLYTANGPSNDISVVDTATLSVIRRIPAGKSPWGVVIGPNPPGSTSAPPHSVDSTAASTESFLQPATAVRFALYLPIQLRQFLGLVGVAKDAAAFAGQGRVLGERPSLHEIVVTHPCCDAVDGACALVQARELLAICGDALVHVLDPRNGRIVVGSGVGVGVGRVCSGVAANRTGGGEPCQGEQAQGGTWMA
ncbi:MAG TPA: cytochrome D1 domain-containing protein [Steroidobacteraceae bacterium]